MFKALFYFFGSIVMLLVLNSKVYELTGKHLLEVLLAIIRFAVCLLTAEKGGQAWVQL